MCEHSDVTALRTDKFIKSLEKSDRHHHHEQQQHFCARHQGDSRRDPLTPALAMLCARGLFPGLPGPRSMSRQPSSVAPAQPRKNFWKEDECTFSDGLPLAMLNPSSSHWHSTSHWPASTLFLRQGLGPPPTLRGPWLSLCHTNPGHTRYPKLLDLIPRWSHPARPRE